MTYSENCIKLIKKLEGLYLTSYKCPANVWTIGWGSITYEDGSPVKKNQTITRKRAEELLKWEMDKKSNEINKLKVWLNNQNQFDAILSFTYNIGIGALRRSTLLKIARINPNDIEIRNQFMRWVNKGSNFEKGLTNRRKIEADLYFS
jgi:lysozyme